MKRSSVILGCLAIACLAIGATIGLVLHFKLPRKEIIEPGPRTQAVGNCIPQGDVSEENCNTRGCTWHEPTDGAPWCTFPAGYGYLRDGPIQDTARGHRVNLKISDRQQALYSPDLSTISLDVEYHTEQRLRLKFADREGLRYQVPREAVDIDSPDSIADNETRLYDVRFHEDPQFGVSVVRRSTGAVVFDTSVAGFTFAEQYLQLTTKLPSGHLYGLGEHNHRQFKHDINWRNWTIFTRDVAPVDDWNLYGAQPMYMNMEEDGNANAVLLLNSNAMDIGLQPDPFPAVTFHVIGGILDFYIFLGPTPENVVQQYTAATGRPVMPPYWSLGYQLSRWDYDNLTHVKTVVDRTRDAGIPQDVQYGDIDHMESKLDFTYDKDKYDGLPAFVDDLHTRGMRYIIILDHCIGSNQTIFDIKLNGSYPPFTEGVSQDVFIRDPRNTNEYLRGEVWPGEVVYPDFTNNTRALPWWKGQCSDLYHNQGIEYDALWIDMNEPSNFVPGSTTGCVDDGDSYNYPPYIPDILEGVMFAKTICMDSPQAWGAHYDVHSLYGHSMSITTWDTLRDMFPDQRPLVLTRSNFVGTQKYAVHWLGDNQSQWRQIPWSIVGMLEYSLFGFTYTGADICGFWYAATEEMCIRWTQLGAFYPYARNHNAQTWPDQDPVALGDTMVRVAKDILGTRYKLLPFLYTLLHEGHVHGNTVVRPMMHEFVSDRKTWSVDTQFLWGPALLITPVMTQGATYVEGYFPSARWYNYYGGLEMENPGTTKNLSTPLDQINLHVRGGYILPWQEPALTTTLSRQNPMGLIVALGDGPQYEARGTLFWDDGISHETYQSGAYLEIEFTTSNFVLNTVILHDNFPTGLKFDTVDIWGLPRDPASVSVDSVALAAENWSFNTYTKALSLVNLDLAIHDDHVIEWVLAD